MNNEQKEQVRAQVNTVAAQGAKKAADAAKKATGWKKWVLFALAVILAAVAVFTQTQCTRVTPEQLQQVQAAHEVYHAVTGEECIFVVEDCKK